VEKIPLSSVIALLPLVRTPLTGCVGKWNENIVDLSGMVSMIGSISKNKTPSETVRQNVQEILGKTTTAKDLPSSVQRVKRMVAAFRGLGDNEPSKEIIGNWLDVLEPKIVSVLKDRLATVVSQSANVSYNVKAKKSRKAKVAVVETPKEPSVLHEQEPASPTANAAQ
jgi:hypothetical protein